MYRVMDEIMLPTTQTNIFYSAPKIPSHSRSMMETATGPCVNQRRAHSMEKSTASNDIGHESKDSSR